MHQHAKRIVNGLVELIGSNLPSNHHPQEVCTYLYVCDENKRWNCIFSTRSGALSTDFYAQMGAEANQTTTERIFYKFSNESGGVRVLICKTSKKRKRKISHQRDSTMFSTSFF
jgi:hypothetical protein